MKATFVLCLVLAGCNTPGTREFLKPPDVLYAVTEATAREAALEYEKTHPGIVIHINTATGSMHGVFPFDNLVVIEIIKFDSLSEGDIVVYDAKWAHNWVAHEIIYRFKGGWLVRGTSTRDSDPEVVTAWNLVGVIRQVYTW